MDVFHRFNLFVLVLITLASDAFIMLTFIIYFSCEKVGVHTYILGFFCFSAFRIGIGRIRKSVAILGGILYTRKR